MSGREEGSPSGYMATRSIICLSSYQGLSEQQGAGHGSHLQASRQWLWARARPSSSRNQQGRSTF